MDHLQVTDALSIVEVSYVPSIHCLWNVDALGGYNFKSPGALCIFAEGKLLFSQYTVST